MLRSKLFAIALAALVAAAGSVLLLSGGATAAQWHAYQGDVHPGHAYGIPVPADAEAIEFAFADAGEGRARFALFDPAGAPVGYYELSSSPTAASLAAPVEGIYVLYVYEVAGGALTLRVNADQAPNLKLQQVPLAREDIVLTRVDAPQAFDQIMTVQLVRAPVFVTLLYEGSATNLDATVASPRGVVATVQDETATAFSPGVWSAQSGVRDSNPAHLAAGAYSIAATADEFQGTLVLTTLALDLAKEMPVPAPVPTPLPPIVPDDAGVFALAAREPVAAMLTAGTLTIGDAAWLNEQLAPADEREDDTDGHKGKHGKHDDRHARVARALIMVYTPSDEVLGVLSLDRDMPVASIEIPSDGEYVIYAARAGDEGLLAKLEGVAGTPATRALEVETVVWEFDYGMGIGGAAPQAFELASVPLEMTLRGDKGISAFDSIHVENEQGVVLWMDRVLSLGPGGIWMSSGQAPEFFEAGEHVLHVNGLVTSTSFRVESLHYLRGTVVETAVVAETAAEEPVEENEEAEETENEEEENGWLPLPPLPLPPL